MQTFFLASLLFLFVLVLRAGVHALILHGLKAPRVRHPGFGLESGQTIHQFRLNTGNGKTLSAWFVPVGCLSPTPAIVVMHGWGANAYMMRDCIKPLTLAGIAVLLLDARCHGLSEDDTFASMPRFSEDLEAGLDWLAAQPQVDSSRLAVMGHSVGAGAALLSATRRQDVRAVVSISAFAHPAEVMRRWLAVYHIPYAVLGWYVLRHVQRVIGARFDDIAPLRSMAHVNCPVLLVHGTEDEMVPINDARRLLAAARSDQVEWVEVAGRHDPTHAIEVHFPQLIRFLCTALEMKEPQVELDVSI